jgi:hypothetical protein
MRPRPASSTYVIGLTARRVHARREQVERHVDGREEEQQEDRHLHQRPAWIERKRIAIPAAQRKPHGS